MEVVVASVAGVDLNTQMSDQIWQMLCEANNEFIPPLSGRESTTDRSLNSPTLPVGAARPHAYFRQMLQQDFLLASRGEEILGFMSFISSASVAEIPGGPTIYISTLIVDLKNRRHGVAQRLYSAILALAEVRDLSVSTRTWSSNTAHIRLLESLGFHLTKRIVNDRGLGVDTVYFARERHTL